MNFMTRRKAMFAILSLGYMLVFLHGVVMTVFAKSLMAEMGLSPAGMGMLGSSYLYSYAGLMLFSGIIAAWAGPRRTLTVLFAVSGLGGLLFAFSDSLPVAMFGRALSGLGMSATMTSSFTVFGRWYAPSDYSRVCSYFFALGGVGTVAGIALLPLLNAAWGWRSVFAGIAILTLVYAFLMVVLVRDWPPAEIRLPAGPSGRLTRDGATMSLLWRNIGEVSRKGDFWRIAVWFMNLPGIYFAFSGLWAIPYLKDVYGMSDAETGLLVSLGGLGFIIGSPIVVVDRQRLALLPGLPRRIGYSHPAHGYLPAFLD